MGNPGYPVLCNLSETYKNQKAHQAIRQDSLYLMIFLFHAVQTTYFFISSYKYRYKPALRKRHAELFPNFIPLLRSVNKQGNIKMLFHKGFYQLIIS